MMTCTTFGRPYASSMNLMLRDTFLLLAYCGLIFFLSSQSRLIDTPLDFPNKDKLIHATAYAIMAYAAWMAFQHHIEKYLLLMLASVLFASMYGISDEFHQSFVIGRDADIWDWLADTVGASIMAAALYRRQLSKASLRNI